MSTHLQRYAELLIGTGVNLQPAQSLRLGAELAHRDLVRDLVAVAYAHGARYVAVDWVDTPLARARLMHSAAEYLSYVPDYEVVRHRQMVDEGWARLALVGPEYPDLLEDVDPAAMRTVAAARTQQLKFYMQAVMANRMQWCVAAAPTPAWASKVFPESDNAEALERLWSTILTTCRVDRDDPAAAWREHSQRLKSVVAFLSDQAVRSLHFLDDRLGLDGRPTTDLVVGLTERPAWLGASAETPVGVTFFPNMPTEEVFSTPHSARTDGYARISKPAFPFDREVRDAYFRFEQGEVVEFSALVGQEVLEQFFAIDGTRRLGEVALVDARSPVGQAGVTFYETLFDENAASHIAFGQAYPGGVAGGDDMDAETLSALGVNKADAHLDVMIGSPTMSITATCADGRTVEIMRDGKFLAKVTGEESE